MVALSLKEDTKLSIDESAVNLGLLSDLTGFPVEYIRRELLLPDDKDLSLEELRVKVLSYLETNF